jgi:hypothetical protein
MQGLCFSMALPVSFEFSIQRVSAKLPPVGGNLSAALRA